MKIKKGDLVIITAGKDKGRKGKVERTFPKENKVLIPGLNLYKKHVKAQSKEKPGGIVETARPLPVANVALVCPKCKKQTRVGYTLTKNGKKKRICRKCKKIID